MDPCGRDLLIETSHLLTLTRTRTLTLTLSRILSLILIGRCLLIETRGLLLCLDSGDLGSSRLIHSLCIVDFLNMPVRLS